MLLNVWLVVVVAPVQRHALSGRDHTVIENSPCMQMLLPSSLAPLPSQEGYSELEAAGEESEFFFEEEMCS